MADVQISFGAVDTQVAAAARRLVGDLEQTRQRFESGWSKTGNAVGKSVMTAFGATVVARQMIGTVSEGLRQYAAVSDMGAAAMDRLAESQNKFLVGLGADYAPFLQGLADSIDMIDEYRRPLVNLVTDLVSWRRGEGEMTDQARKREIELTKVNRALKESAVLSRQLRSETLKSQGRGDESEVFDETEKHKANTRKIDAMPAGVQGKLRAEEEERHRAEMDRIEREIAARVQKAQMEQVAMRRASAEAEERMNAQMREQGQALEFATMEANIVRMRAEGRTKEADAEQIRLDTLRKILEIKKMEFATDEAKASAISALYKAQNAELAALGGEEEVATTKSGGGSRSIAAGLANSSLIGQVFGGSASGSDPIAKRLDEAKKIAASHTPLLKKIAENTAKSGATFQN